MNEALVKELVKYKLKAASTIIENLPPEVSGGIRNLGKIILESLNENSREMQTQSTKKSKTPDKLDSIPID